MDKRSFLKTSSLLGLGSLFSFQAMGKFLDSIANMSPEEAGQDEDLWATIRKGYRLKPDYINLENGYYCFMPEELLEQYITHVREVNLQGSYYMRTVQFDNKKAAAARVADLAGCISDEVIITRNTTESLDMIISGIDWRTGDEAVMAHQDYGAMLDMFQQEAKRHRMINKIVSIPNNPKNDDEIVKIYADAITPETRLLMVSHMINITGQIMPVRKICDMAHTRNVPVMVDGAHALAHIKLTIPELHCDYYGASLHKWLSVPLGAGMLWMDKKNVNKIWPLFADSSKKNDDILKLNHTGTIPVATDLTIADAIDFYQKLGPEKKEARLRYLQNYWTSKVRHMPHVILNTPSDPARSCGIANVGVKGLKPADLADILLKQYKIYTVAIDNEKAGVHGCRVTPNIYTTTAELDTLVDALKHIKA